MIKKKRKKSQKKHNPSTKKEKKKVFIIKGTIYVHQSKAFGFVVPENLEKFPYDVFVSQKNMFGALDEDFVEVKASQCPSSCKESFPKWKGSIISVIKRGKASLTAIIKEFCAESLTAEAYVPSIGSDKTIKVYLLPEFSPYKKGDRIVIENLPWYKKRPDKNKIKVFPKMLRFIGNIDNASLDLLFIKEEFGITEDFSPEVINETKNFSEKNIQNELLDNRRDLRDLLCFTIDSSSAKDFDDAISLEETPEGNFVLGVHISDVSHYVQADSLLDKEASKRCNSIYFIDKVIPMLPFILSDNLCSLKPNLDRLAITVKMTLNNEGILKDYEIFKSIIKSKYRLTYPEVNSILQRKQTHPTAAILHKMNTLSLKLQELKETRGCFPFSFPSAVIKLNQNGEPINFQKSEQTNSHKLIEEFMLKANETIAIHLTNLETPIPYRIHEEPEEHQLAIFRELLTSCGIEVTMTENQEYDYQLLLKKTLNLPLEQFLHINFIRSMKIAYYSTNNKGHYGLKLKYYTHFTSPIRRYSDLLVHRLLFSNQEISTQKLDVLVKTCSQKERLSAKAEQNFEKIKKMRFFKKLMQMDKNKTYEALIIKSKPDGILISIPEFLHEDFIPIAFLPQTFLFSSPSSLTGRKIVLTLKTVNLISLTLTWSIQLPETIKKNKKKPHAQKKLLPLKKSS